MASETPLVLHYWPIKARNVPSILAAKVANLPIELSTSSDIGAMKASGELPFGQFPYLVHGDVKLAQSNAIFRYICRIGGLQGSDDAEFAFSEMLIEEANDLFNLMVKAQYGGDKVQAYNDLFAAGSNLHTQLAYCEKLHKGEGPGFFPRPTAGGIAIASALIFLSLLEPTILDTYPKLKSLHDHVVASPAYDAIRDMPLYFSRS